MAKTKEELAQLKNEYESLNNKLKELTDEEFKQVAGGFEKEISIQGLEAIGPYAVGGIPLDTDSKLKS